MSIIVSWKLIGLAIVYHINYLNCNGFTAAAINLSDESESAMIDESFEQPRIWSTLLEDLTINGPSSVERDGRSLHHSYKYIPTTNMYINKRVENLVPLGPSALKQNFQFQGASTGGPSNTNNFFNNRVPPPNGSPNRHPSNAPQEVSETDLYLLSAIEKLVYRVDYMERRLRKTEQIVYYLMAGNNEHRKEIYGKNELRLYMKKKTLTALVNEIQNPFSTFDYINARLEKPCSMNFTRVGNNCYLFVSNQLANWKTANNVCRSYGAYLAELEGLNEHNDIAAYLLNHLQLLNEHNANFWLGGLNPGLLWIWSSSARPVNPNVNLTQIHNSTSQSAAISHIAPKVSTKLSSKDSKKAIVNKKESNTNATTTTTPPNKSAENSKAMSNDEDFKIDGDGRCLGLSYKSHKHIYQLHGLDCTSQQKFICELPQDHIDNEIDRIAKKLFH